MTTRVLVELLLSSLATWAIVEVYQHGDIFSSVRGRMEASESFIARAFQCPFCLSHWVAMLTTGLAIAMWVPELHWSLAPHCFLLWLASVRTANALNDLMHSTTRTPKEELLPELEIHGSEGSEEPPGPRDESVSSGE